MCGIAGVVAPNAGVYRGAVAAMLDAMSHRGPDGSGVWESPSGSCVLGHRRLAILDLSDNAAQPMVMPNRKFAISYNGECYDFSAIKESLVRDGDQFQSTGDTEVFLKLLARHGEGALAEVNAMFALAFWDEDRRTLLLARDRFGQKPLYWTQRDGVLVFASEVRALLASGLVDRTISQDGLAGFLCHGAVQDPLTIIKDVYSLPRGTSLTFRYGATKELKKFWEHNYTRCAATPADVREEVCQAVRRHLISDVPVGVFLSGGVDSSIIAAAASQSSVSNVKSLAVVFPDQRESCEAEYAKRASKISGTEHIEVPVSDSDMLEYVQQAVERFDQPSADGVNTFIVSGAARQAGLRVALSGLGGDELFGGYSSFRDVSRMLKIQSWGRWLSPMTKWMGPWQKWDRRWSKIQDLFSAPQGLLSAYLGRRRLFSSVQIESLLSGKCGNAWQSGFTSERHTDLLAAICGMDPLNAIAHLELDVYMGQTLLRDSDAMGMAHSLEIRVPFLDTKLSGLVLGMPATLRSANPRPKWMLIKAFEQELPKENLQRSKQGFSLPWQQWLDGPLKNTVKEGIAVLSDICEPMSATIVNSVWQKYQANPSRVGWSRPWSLYVLAKYIERNGLKAPQFGDSSQGSMVKSAAA